MGNELEDISLSTTRFLEAETTLTPRRSAIGQAKHVDCHTNPVTQSYIHGKMDQNPTMKRPDNEVCSLVRFVVIPIGTLELPLHHPVVVTLLEMYNAALHS